MKKIIFTFALLASTNTLMAQTQLANADFEQWEEVSYKKGMKNVKGNEPLYWSSFIDGTGGLKGAAVAEQLFKVEDPRPDSEGKYCAKITANSVAGVVAQGNLTNGCVNMGSMTATDASGNYNYINHSRADQAMKFTGRPSSVKLWLKGNCVNNASIAIHLVGDGYYQDPEVDGRNKAMHIGFATKTIAVNNQWKEYEIEFAYIEDDAPQYALVNISTSAIPGKGNSSDVLFIDDIVMQYDMTAISHTTETASQATTAYNLLGQKVTSKSRGIVINNGKKFINK